MTHKGPNSLYSIEVFEEILQVADQNKIDCLLICGDFFDTFEDAENLRHQIRSLIQNKPYSIYYLPGNHEELKKGKNNLSHFDFGELVLLDHLPTKLTTLTFKSDNIELLSIPHQHDYSAYPQWKVPKKKCSFRLAMIHGIVSGMTYSGPDNEEGGGAIDPEMFQFFSVDYAAMGHIHSQEKIKYKDCLIQYPGSARLWRRGENGPKGVLLLTIDNLLQTTFIPLKKAGLYRLFETPLSLTGDTPHFPHAKEWSIYDYIDIKLSGVIDDESRVKKIEQDLTQKFKSKVRELRINQDNLSILSGISEQPIAKQFLEAWETKRPDNDEELPIWYRCREIGLEQIKNSLDKF